MITISSECQKSLNLLHALERHTLNGRHLCANRVVTDLMFNLRKSLESLSNFIHLGSTADEATIPDYQYDKPFNEGYIPSSSTAPRQKNIEENIKFRNPINVDNLSSLGAEKLINTYQSELLRSQEKIESLKSELREQKEKLEYMKMKVQGVLSSSSDADIGLTSTLTDDRRNIVYKDELRQIDSDIERLKEVLFRTAEGHAKKALATYLESLIDA